MIIDVAETTPGRFSARIGARVLLVSSHTPFFAAARVLRAQGVDPEEPLVMRHNGVESLRATVGEAARLTVKEMADGSQPPAFRPFAEGPAARAAKDQGLD